jgi:hypothetical protein
MDFKKMLNSQKDPEMEAEIDNLKMKVETLENRLDSANNKV